MELPKRKHNRLPGYDYCMPGYYFITICTRNKEKLFWDDPSGAKLSVLGKTVEECILSISQHYPGVTLDKYVVMPNHVHFILCIDEQAGLQSVSIMVGQMKRAASAKTHEDLWQKSFHDHVIRNEKDYQMIWEYIDGNPAKWNEDCFYVE